MDKKIIISTLLEAANIFDDKGFHDNADELTAISKKLAQINIEVNDNDEEEAFYPPYCGDCGQHCSTKKVDNGFDSPTGTGIHHNWQEESTCCGSPYLYKDPALTIEI